MVQMPPIPMLMKANAASQAVSGRRFHAANRVMTPRPVITSDHTTAARSPWAIGSLQPIRTQIALATFRLAEEVVDLQTALEILPQKCAVRDVSYEDAGDFFPPLIISEAERQWETGLADLVRLLPSFDDVITGLRVSLRTLLGGH